MAYNSDIVNFYNQPLPETAEEINKLIIKLFKYDGRIKIRNLHDFNFKQIEFDMPKGWMQIDFNGKTLSDLIDACKNSNINLRWK